MKKISGSILAVLLLIFTAQAQTAEVTLQLNEQFFDTLLDAIFKNTNPPEFPLSDKNPKSETQSPKSGLVGNSFVENKACTESIKLQREVDGTRTAVRFRDGDVWPRKFAGADPSRTDPPCPGQNVSPPLEWSNAPARTKSFAILMFDPDGGGGPGASHWVAYNIPASKTRLMEGEASASPKDFTGGRNNVGHDH